MKKSRLFGAFCGCLFILFNAQTNSAPVLDQSSVWCSFCGAYAITNSGNPIGSQSIAQTFTAGISGLLSLIHLSLHADKDAAAGFTLHIFQASGQQVDSSAGSLFSQTYPVSAIPDAPTAYNQFDISSAGIFVTPGDELAVALTREPGDPGSISYWVSWDWTNTDYSAGMTWWDPLGGTNFTASRPPDLPPEEMMFRTYVDPSATPPVPIPPALWLFGSGLLGLIGFSRRKNNE